MAMASSRQPEFSIVFFDLKTTGLTVTDEIIQIAAKCGDAKYNYYVVPSVEIPEATTDLTGISMTNKQMYRHGQPVKSMFPRSAAATFTFFLKALGGKVILVSHNCFKFNGPMLAGLMDAQGMIEGFKETVVGFSDSLPLLKKCLPAERETGTGLIELAEEFLGSSSDSHDAFENATMLEKLILHKKINIKADDIIDSRRSVSAMTQKYKNRLHSYEQGSQYDDDSEDGCCDLYDDYSYPYGFDFDY